MASSHNSNPESSYVTRAVAAARETLEQEIGALSRLLERLDLQIERSLEILLTCQGRVVITGLGKSGLVGTKIAATLSSTGTPSFFIHATEALHGDSGAFLPRDVLIAISNSGETPEVCAFAQLASDSGGSVIAMVGNPASSLAIIADIVLDISIQHEADPLNLAPTASTTVTIALGDAVASALMTARGFTAVDFVRCHPSGSLGTKLAATKSSGIQS